MSKESTDLFHALIHTTKAAVRGMISRSGLGLHSGLTGPQFGLMGTLHHKGPLSPSELCEIMMVTPANITGMIARLKKLGLVERRRLSSDRRCLKIDLTPLGREKVENLIPVWRKAVSDCFSLFPADDQRTLITLLNRFREAIGASTHASDPPGGHK